MKIKLDVSVVTITYNERENIEKFIEALETQLRKGRFEGEIVVVDDSSPDGTGEIVRELTERFGNIRLITRPQKLGIASAFREGIKNAQGEIIVTMDADFSHPPARIGKLVKTVRKGSIALGSRFIVGSHLSTSFPRRVATKTLNFLTSVLGRTGVKDHTNGYLAISREHLGQIRKLGEEYGIDPYSRLLYGIPICLVAKKLDIPLKEVATPYEWRKRGETKIPFLTGFKTIMAELIFLLRTVWQLR